MQTRNAEAKLSNILGISSFANGPGGQNKLPDGGLTIQTQSIKQTTRAGGLSVQSPAT